MIVAIFFMITRAARSGSHPNRSSLSIPYPIFLITLGNDPHACAFLSALRRPRQHKDAPSCRRCDLKLRHWGVSSPTAQPFILRSRCRSETSIRFEMSLTMAMVMLNSGAGRCRSCTGCIRLGHSGGSSILPGPSGKRGFPGILASLFRALSGYTRKVQVISARLSWICPSATARRY